jgi:hypothetical protein
MKSSIIYAIGFLAAAGILFLPVRTAPGQEKIDLALKLKFIEREISEDSNSQTVVIAIENNKAIYDWHYGGYHPDPAFSRSKKKQFVLNNTQLSEIIKALIKEKLDQNLTEKLKPVGQGHEVECDLEIRLAGKKTAIRLHGMRELFAFNRKAGPTLTSKDKLKSIKNLIALLERMIGVMPH